MKPFKNITLRAATALAVALSLGYAPQVSTYAAGTKIKVIDVQQGKSMNGNGALLLDVREPDEYEQGHAPGSVLIPLGQLKNRLREIRAFDSKPIAIICRSGRRSAQAAEILSQAGFADVSNVQGGMIAWETAALPIVKRK